MKLIKLMAGAAALQFLVLAPAAGQAVNETAPIVVTAPQASERERVNAFVGALTPPNRRAAMPRWGQEVCPGVMGMRSEHARALNDRVARVALDLGLDVGAPGCNANIIVYFTRNSDQLAEALARPGGMISVRGATREAVNGFVRTPRAVRWWHLSSTNADGFEIQTDTQAEVDTLRNSEPQAGEAGSENRTDEQRRQAAIDLQAAAEVTDGARVRGAGRLRSNVTENLARVLIIVDAERVSGIQFRSLADYIAMISLAQINPSADVTTAPSILNLFAQTSGPKADALTAWDRAYLAGLYATPEDARDAQQQETMIVRSMISN